MTEETSRLSISCEEDTLTIENSPRQTAKNKIKPKAAAAATANTVRGRPKSGRIWKQPKKKFSSIIKTRGIRSAFEKKQKLREELKSIKEASRDIVAKKKEEAEAKKQRRRDNLKKQEANRLKSEVVQVITNTGKLKRMKKKQLRYIEKRDTTVVQK